MQFGFMTGCGTIDTIFILRGREIFSKKEESVLCIGRFGENVSSST